MSTYVTKANIFIAGIKINKYKTIKVEKSLDGSKATITYPDNLQLVDKYLYRSGSDNNPMATGQYIYIDMGWDKLKSNDFETTQKNTYFDAIVPSEENTSQFVGFISKITQNFKSREITVECEDYNYLLKRTRFDFSEKKITLKALGEKIVAELPRLDVSMNIDPNDFIWVNFNESEVTTGLEFTLHKYVAEKQTGYDILTYLADEFNIRCVWYGQTLIMGVNYLNPDIGYEKEFRFTQIPKEKQTTKMLYALDSGGLTWQNSKDVKYKVTANVIDKTLEKKEYKLGDDDGAEREFWFYGDYTDKDVEGLITNELSRLRYDGFKEGSKITSFGRMATDYRDRGVDIFDTIILDGIDYKVELNGKKTVLPTSAYLCAAVTYTMDNKGFNAEITLGQLFPIKVESFYETNESFNTNNLEYTATYEDFQGKTTFNVASGTAVVETTLVEEEPVEDEEVVETDIKILKNILAKYKTSSEIVEIILEEETDIINTLNGNVATSTFLLPLVVDKGILNEPIGNKKITYDYYSDNGGTLSDAKYNPTTPQKMVINDVSDLEIGDVGLFKNFNISVDNFIINLDKIIGYIVDIESEENKGVDWDLSKLTDEETVYYNSYKESNSNTSVIHIPLKLR
tara:strand:+ start:4022 stop:5905 length:1884 start_codon:yes stop_codon:yes gene_type:complete